MGGEKDSAAGTYSAERYRQHGLHASVLDGAQHSLLAEQSSTGQRPEPDVLDADGHKVCV